jgi:hypothetical protein
MTDVATIHFKQILERLGEKPQSVTKSFKLVFGFSSVKLEFHCLLNGEVAQRQSN